MSYDYEFYVGRIFSPDVPNLGSSALLSCDGPDRLEDEDLPEEVRPLVGKRRLLYQLHLQGSPDTVARAKCNAWLSELLARTRGVLVDLQTDRYETADKSGTLAAPVTPPGKPGRPPSAPSRGQMSFHFPDAEGFCEHGFRRMLDVIAETMPAALPTRFGHWEPLQGKVENGELGPLLAAFAEDPQILLQAKAPFGHIGVAIPCRRVMERWHPDSVRQFGFLMPGVRFDLRPKLFDAPAQLAELLTLFERLSVELDVVYSEIATRSNWLNAGGWRWRGLPHRVPHSLSIGRAYRRLWPEGEAHGRPVGRHHLLMTSDRFGTTPLLPPKALMADGLAGYARVFPFPREPEDPGSAN